MIRTEMPSFSAAAFPKFGGTSGLANAAVDFPIKIDVLEDVEVASFASIL